MKSNRSPQGRITTLQTATGFIITGPRDGHSLPTAGSHHVHSSAVIASMALCHQTRHIVQEEQGSLAFTDVSPHFHQKRSQRDSVLIRGISPSLISKQDCARTIHFDLNPPPLPRLLSSVFGFNPSPQKVSMVRHPVCK